MHRFFFYSISTDRFIELSKEASKVFSTNDRIEPPELYFDVHRQERQGKIRTHFGGRLQEKFSKLRSKLIKENIIKPEDVLPDGKYSIKHLFFILQKFRINCDCSQILLNFDH